MKLGIIGLPGSGKSTVFKALTGGMEISERKGYQEAGLGVVTVDDPRMDYLAAYYKTKKLTPVHVEYRDIAGFTGEGEPGREIGDRVLSQIRPTDALIHCVRVFDSPLLGPPEPVKDLTRVEEEMILSDLAVVEKRIERLDRDIKKGRKELIEELELLRSALSILGEGKALRSDPHICDADKMRGFAFLSAKPELVLLNVGDTKAPDDVRSTLEAVKGAMEGQQRLAFDFLYADTESEIASMSPDDAREFLEEFGIEEGAKSRIAQESFRLLNLITFFTAGDKEVHAWALRRGSNSLAAAGTVHSDMERGFIRAEVVAYDDFVAAGSVAEVHKQGKFRLEGRDYQVRDGDIVVFRFNI
ncbi:MAG: DUF933 domain-containing protein [Pseudomonadota bacterium]